MAEARGQILSFPTQYITETCCNCGMQFCLTKDFYDQLQRENGSFCCPRGHSQHYTETRVMRLEKELKRKEDDLRREREWHETTRKSRDRARRSASAYKGKVTKIKNRIHNGVCPCCKRHFTNLERHMKMQHPDFNKKEAE